MDLAYNGVSSTCMGSVLIWWIFDYDYFMMITDGLIITSRP